MKKNNQNKSAIIAGCGLLGSRMAGDLSLEDWDVVVIDISKRAFAALPPYFGGEIMTGGATDLAKLEEAGIKNASLFISSAGSDDVNIVSSQIAKTLYGVKTVIARIRDNEKAELAESYGIKVICPPSLSIKEIKETMEKDV